MRVTPARPPAPCDRDPGFAATLKQADDVYAKAQAQVADKHLVDAHATLEEARDLMADLRRRNGVIVCSDHMNAHHEEMEQVLNEAAVRDALGRLKSPYSRLFVKFGWYRRREHTMSSYVIGKTVALSFADAERRIVEELAKVGFGILTEIDVQATMKKKLGLEMPPYRILGACNPKFASQAIAVEPAIGALLPCNAVVRQDAAGAVHVELMDPNAVLRLVDKPEVTTLATEVRQRLEQALAQV